MVWITTEDASIDLQLIAEDGIANFVEKHAREYLDELLGTIELLAAMPQLAPERSASRQVVRLMPRGAHNIIYIIYIIYIIDNEDVLILRVLHGLQDWFDLL